MFRKLTAMVIASTLAGCAGMSEQECLVSDWRTVGFEDGTAGRPAGSIGSYREACSKHGVTPDLATYRAGHAEGVELYCRPTRGFETGRRGRAYQGVCPADLEPDFLAAYESERHLHELESALRRVDSRIASNDREQARIKRELAEITATIAGGEATTEEGVLLVAEAAELGSRHSELSSETEALRDERVVQAAELETYRRTLAFDF